MTRRDRKRHVLLPSPSMTGAPRVGLSVACVPVAPGTPDGMLSAPHGAPALVTEREMLDVQADGRRIVAPPPSHLDEARARRLRLWAERGDFSRISASTLARTPMDEEEKGDSDALARLHAAYAPPATLSSPTAAPVPLKLGRIPESEFVPVRNDMLHQLEVALFHAEQAQNLLGMLIQQARGASAGPVLAAQSEYFLEPSSLSLSALETVLPDDAEPLPPPPLSKRQQVIQSKRESLQSASHILAQGADEIKRCLPPERTRWQALSHIQKRGWKLTPGRPLVDMERLDQQPASVGSALYGFGMPVLHGDGAVKDEGARDAWIGYGPSEAPVPVLQRTLAYWADATTSSASLAFPDRAWRRLRVQIRERTASGECVWTSADAAPDPGTDFDAQLYDAQRDAVDAELFRELAAQSGALSPMLPRTVTDSCITVPLTSTLDVSFMLVPYERDTEAPHTQSMWATILLHGLRLRMLRSWTLRMTALRRTHAASVAQRPAAPRASLTAPLWDLYKYTLFLARFQAVLAPATHGHDVHIDWRPFDGLQDAQAWVTHLLDVVHDDGTSVLPCSGHVLLYLAADRRLVVQFALQAPSHLVAFFPLHRTPTGTGMRLSLELEQVAACIAAELASVATLSST